MTYDDGPAIVHLYDPTGRRLAHVASNEPNTVRLSVHAAPVSAAKVMWDTPAQGS